MLYLASTVLFRHYLWLIRQGLLSVQSDKLTNPLEHALFLLKQCRDGVGVCPDKASALGGTCREDNFNIQHSINNGVTCVTYSRLLDTGEIHAFVQHVTMCDVERQQGVCCQCLHQIHVNISLSQLFLAGDANCDKTIDMATLDRTYIIWAVGPRGVTAFQHFARSGGEHTKHPVKDIACSLLLYCVPCSLNTPTQSHSRPCQ